MRMRGDAFVNLKRHVSKRGISLKICQYFKRGSPDCDRGLGDLAPARVILCWLKQSLACSFDDGHGSFD